MFSYSENHTALRSVWSLVQFDFFSFLCCEILIFQSDWIVALYRREDLSRCWVSAVLSLEPHNSMTPSSSFLHTSSHPRPLNRPCFLSCCALIIVSLSWGGGEMSDEGSTPHGSKRASPNIPSNWAQKWSDEEDKRLLMGIEQYGENNWRMVAKIVGTRDAGKSPPSVNNIKIHLFNDSLTVKCMQRWEKGLKPGIIKGRWSEEEDRALVYLVSQGYKNWGQVAQHMPGRTSKQCRERWNHYLDPTLIHTPFTEEEDQLLLSLQSEHGNKWALIARNIPGRTENAVKLRHHALMKKTPSQQYVSNSSKDMGRLTSAENHLHSDINRLVFRENGDNGHVNHSNPNDTSNPEHARFLHNLHLMASEGMYRRDEERVDNNSMLQQQHQHQQRLYNTLRENNDNRHPMASFQHFQQQQLQQHYHVPPPFGKIFTPQSQYSFMVLA